MKTLKPCIGLLLASLVLAGGEPGRVLHDVHAGGRRFRRYPRIVGSRWPQGCLGKSGSRQGRRDPERTRGLRRRQDASRVHRKISSGSRGRVEPDRSDSAGRRKQDSGDQRGLGQGIESNLDAALIKDRLHESVKYAVKNHVVTLTGEVDSQGKRARAEAVALSVLNVQQVVNELQVKARKASSPN